MITNEFVAGFVAGWWDFYWQLWALELIATPFVLALVPVVLWWEDIHSE